MTNQQFTQEYIQFILSDKAKALQALWNLASYSVGDHVLVGGRLGIVADLDTRDYFADEGVRYFAIAFDHPNRRALGDPEREVWERHSLTWLPSLFQLLRIIEGAGWRWRTVAEQDTVEQAMLTAAQLAVRAVQNV